MYLFWGASLSKWGKQHRSYDTGLEYFLEPKRSLLYDLAELPYFDFLTWSTGKFRLTKPVFSSSPHLPANIDMRILQIQFGKSNFYCTYVFCRIAAGKLFTIHCFYKEIKKTGHFYMYKPQLVKTRKFSKYFFFNPKLFVPCVYK